eukprot:augustus_masked-scaffold_5-processed-gene-18.11-mRNA-1 protein AED:1.00 eAED:1.00 QI:0/-1/0/0/-1/1/1/0/1263
MQLPARPSRNSFASLPLLNRKSKKSRGRKSVKKAKKKQNVSFAPVALWYVYARNYKIGVEYVEGEDDCYTFDQAGYDSDGLEGLSNSSSEFAGKMMKPQNGLYKIYIGLGYPFSLTFTSFPELGSDFQTAVRIWEMFEQSAESSLAELKIANEFNKVVENSYMLKLFDRYYNLPEPDKIHLIRPAQGDLKILVSVLQKDMEFKLKPDIHTMEMDSVGELNNNSIADIFGFVDDLLKQLYSEVNELIDVTEFELFSGVIEDNFFDVCPRYAQLSFAVTAIEELNVRPALNAVFNLLHRYCVENPKENLEYYCRDIIRKTFHALFHVPVQLLESVTFEELEKLNGIVMDKRILKAVRIHCLTEGQVVNFFANRIIDKKHASDSIAVPPVLLNLGVNKFFFWPQKEWLQLQLKITDLYISAIHMGISYAMINDCEPLLDVLTQWHADLPPVIKDAAVLFESNKKKYDLIPVERALNTSSHKMKAKRVDSGQTPIKVNTLFGPLNPLLGADLAFSERDVSAKCPLNCGSHRGRLVLMLISLGRAHMVQRFANAGFRFNTSVCYGEEEAYNLDWTEGSDRAQDHRLITRMQQPFQNFQKRASMLEHLASDPMVDAPFKGYLEDGLTNQQCERHKPTPLSKAIDLLDDESNEEDRQTTLEIVLRHSSFKYLRDKAVHHTLPLLVRKEPTLTVKIKNLYNDLMNDPKTKITAKKTDIIFAYEALMCAEFDYFEEIFPADPTEADELVTILLKLLLFSSNRRRPVPRFRAIIYLIQQREVELTVDQIEALIKFIVNVTKTYHNPPGNFSSLLKSLCQTPVFAKVAFPRVSKLLSGGKLSIVSRGSVESKRRSAQRVLSSVERRQVATKISRVKTSSLLMSLVVCDVQDLVRLVLINEKIDAPTLQNGCKLAFDRYHYEMLEIIFTHMHKKYGNSGPLLNFCNSWTADLMERVTNPQIFEEINKSEEFQELCCMYDCAGMQQITLLCQKLISFGIKPDIESIGPALLRLILFSPFGTEVSYINYCTSYTTIKDFSHVRLWELLMDLFFGRYSDKSKRKSIIKLNERGQKGPPVQNIVNASLPALRPVEVTNGPMLSKKIDQMSLDSRKSDGSSSKNQPLKDRLRGKRKKGASGLTIGVLLQALLEEVLRGKELLWYEGLAGFFEAVEKLMGRGTDALETSLVLYISQIRKATFPDMQQFELVFQVDGYVVRRPKESTSRQLLTENKRRMRHVGSARYYDEERVEFDEVGENWEEDSIIELPDIDPENMSEMV